MEQGFAFSFTPEELEKYPVANKPQQLSLDLRSMTDYVPVTKRQREAIVLIEKYTMHVFLGKDANDASDFISQYMDESIAASRARGYNGNCKAYHTERRYRPSDEDDYLSSIPIRDFDEDDYDPHYWGTPSGIFCKDDM